MKFIHAADLHLDSPLRNLERYEGAPVEALRGATRRALENLVALALQEAVDLVLIAGDLYDGDWRDYNTGLFFNRQMARLREANINVVLLSGNHDAASEITKTLRSVDQLSNVHRLSNRRPQTVKLDCAGLEVAVHGQGFARKAVTDNLAAAYPQALADCFNIGLLHTSLSCCPGHAPYAPCSLDELKSKGYDYWALGHVHQREILCKSPWIAFSGNTQGRDIGETGAKGCLLVTVEQSAISVEFKALDVLRWRHCQVDVTGAADDEEVLERIKAQLLPKQPTWEGPEAVRLEIVGACQAHASLNRQTAHWINELRAQATDLSNGNLWLEKVRIATRGEISLEHLAAQTDGPGLLLRAAQTLQLEDLVLKRLLKERDSLKHKLPSELQDEAWLQVEEPVIFERIKEDVIQLLLPRLSIEGDSTQP